MSGFGKLWAAGMVASLGNGLALAAGPLLAATLTEDPVRVAGLMIAEQLPWVLLALPAGAVVDRLDRRRLMTVSSLARVLALGLLGLVVAVGHASFPLLYMVFLLAGCAGVLFENASITAVPATVGGTGLERANGRMLAARTLGQTLIGPPLAGVLFVVAAWAPFALDASAFVLVAALSVALPVAVGEVPAGSARTTLRAALTEGVRWLTRHRVLRTLAITVAMSNMSLGAVFSILVLIAQQRLGVGPVGYGLLLTAGAVGGIAGGLVTSRIVARLGTTTTLRAGLILEALSHLGLALTRNAVLAGTILAILALQLTAFSTITASLRQSLAPPHMLGRIHGAYRLLSNGGLLLGASLGGLIAQTFGLTAPFWLGLTAVTTVTAYAWRRLTADSSSGYVQRSP